MSFDSGSSTYSDDTASTSNLEILTLTNQLASSDVIVSTATGSGGDGDITVEKGFAWNSANSLTLDADRHITTNVGATIVNSGTGGLTFNAGGDVTMNGGVSLTGGAGCGLGRANFPG